MSLSQKTLFLDLASNPGLLALVIDMQVAAEDVLDNRTSDTTIVPAIEALIRKAGLSSVDLERVAAVIGPGGFMSLRVAVSIANALAWSLKIPMAGIHASDLWAARLYASPLKPHTFVWLHSTKKDLLFVRGFGSLAKRWPEPALISVEEAIREIPPETPYNGELIEAHRMELRTLSSAASVSLSDVLPTFLAGITYDKKSLEPWYGRGT